MNRWRFPFILLISLILFLINIGTKRPPYKLTKTSPLIESHLTRMRGIQSREDFALSRAFILGDKRSLTKDLKTKFSGLHINHLFTPSGIHFSSFFILFLPLIKKLRKKEKKKLAFCIELTLCLLPFGLNQFYSLKRISILRISSMTFRGLKYKIDFFHIFLLSFLFDFIFGTYSKNPMSYAFSFLFLGSLLSNTRLSSVALSFFSANLLLTIFFPIKVSLIGFFLGFFLTSIFSLLFPFLFISYWLSSLIYLNLSYPFLYIIQFLSNFFYQLSLYSSNLEIDLIGLIFILIYSFNRKLRFLLLALSLSSPRIYNVPTSRILQKENHLETIQKVWSINKGVERSVSQGKSCRRKILISGHQIRCRNTKRR